MPVVVDDGHLGAEQHVVADVHLMPHLDVPAIADEEAVADGQRGAPRHLERDGHGTAFGHQAVAEARLPAHPEERLAAHIRLPAERHPSEGGKAREPRPDRAVDDLLEVVRSPQQHVVGWLSLHSTQLAPLLSHRATS
jgi:hypothetical protein